MKSRAEEVLARRKRELALGQNTEEPVVDTSDPDVVREQEKKAERRQERKEQVLKDILSTTQGREWIGDWLVFCDVMGSPFVRNSPEHTAFNIGMQEVGRMILKQIFDVAPDKYPKMLKEAKERLEE